VKLTATNAKKPKTGCIVCRTSKQFFDAMHAIEAGGWRWWRIHQKLPGPEKYIETNMPHDNENNI
jgi:hypothetical protein